MLSTVTNQNQGLDAELPQRPAPSSTTSNKTKDLQKKTRVLLLLPMITSLSAFNLSSREGKVPFLTNFLTAVCTDKATHDAKAEKNQQIAQQLARIYMDRKPLSAKKREVESRTGMPIGKINSLHESLEKLENARAELLNRSQ